MKRLYEGPLFLGLAFFLLGNLAAFGESPASDAAVSPLLGAQLGAAKGKIAASDHQVWRESYARLPLSFEANFGQTDPGVKFLSRGSGYTLFLTNSGAVLTLHGVIEGSQPRRVGGEPNQLNSDRHGTTSVLGLSLAGADPQAVVAGADKLPGKVNYFIGNDPKKWHSNIPTYGKVQYRDVYPGVDLTYYGNQGQLEYDFAVAPGADARNIRLRLQGADKVRVGPNGDLILSTPTDEVRLRKPYLYQTESAAAGLPNEQTEAAPARHEISGRYVVRQHNEIGFEVGPYDPKQTLIIDPVLVYSTYLGGSNDEKLLGVALTSSNQLVVVGDTASANYPVTTGAFQATLGGTRSVLVTELSADGSSLVFSTYLGGATQDGGWGVVVDSSGDIYVDGFTSSSNFPLMNAYQGTLVGAYDTFLSKFDSTGSNLLYSTYIGQMDYTFLVDGTVGLAANNNGLAYVCSATNSSSYPTTPGAFQTTFAGADDGVLTVLDTTKSGQSSLVYGTFLGGSAPANTYTAVLSVALDSSDNVYTTGYTHSTNFPTTTGSFAPSCPQTGACSDNAFVAKINPAGHGSQDLVYSTYFGGSDSNVTHGLGIAVDSSGDAYISGFTQAGSLPTTPGAFQTTCSKCGGTSPTFYDGFAAKISPGGKGSGDLIYSTYLGGTHYDEPKFITLDSSNDAYIFGRTTSPDFPLMNPLQAAKAGPSDTGEQCSGDCAAYDGFITELNPTGTAALFSTYNGGSNFDGWNAGVLDSSGNLYAAGRSESSNYAATAGAFQPAHAGIVSGSAGLDGIVAKISPTDAPGVGFGPASVPACGTNVPTPCFGNQAVGTSSSQQNIVLTAAGGAPLVISNISTSGPFAQTSSPSCVTTLPPGSQCTVNVTFSPTATGSQNGTLTITDNAASPATPSPQNIPLTGTGTATGPVVSLSPTTLTFASQSVGTTSSAQPVTLTNTGVATLSITSVSLTGANPGDFLLPASANPCGSTLAAGVSCTISVTFTPTATGTRTASVSIADNAPFSPQVVTFTGTGTSASGPAVTLAPNSLTFSSQGVGTTSPAQAVTLTNAGTSALSITSISVTGTNPGDFAQTNNCGTTVAASGTCTINVTFTPTATGTRIASVGITDNAPGSPQLLPLTGTGASTGNPAVSLSPTSLIFPLQVVGQSGTAQVVTLTNTGTGALSVTSIGFTGTYSRDYTETDTCTGVSVAAGANCTISVTFRPHQSTPPVSAATLSITDNATGSPQSVALSGTGTFVQLVPTSLPPFASQAVGTTSAAQTVTLTNTQPNNPISISGITITGTDASDFAQTNTCGSSVAIGGSCSISVTFTPAASGTRTASVSITDNGGGSPQTVTLTGTGTGAPAVTLAPTSLPPFAGQAVGAPSAPQSVTLTNSGSAALSITSVSITGANAGDFAQTNTCGTSVAAGASCSISVTFTPATTGTLTASLSIADNAAGSPQTVALSGTGATAPTAGLSPSTISFGSQAIGSTSSAQTVTLTNTGGSALTINGISATGPFAKTSACGSSLGAGASCTISVTFSPTTATAASGTLTVTDNAASSPQAVSLTGTGITPPGASLSPASITFSPSQVVGTASAAQTVTLTNTGAGTLTITSVSLTNGSFVETSGSTCGTSLAAAASCTIAIEFKPLLAGTISGSLMVTDNAPSSPQSVTLTGTGVAAGVGFQPSTGLVFPGEPLNTSSAPQYVTLTNTSNTTALSISSITITGTDASDFSIGSNTCPMSSGSTLAAGGACKISVTFSPTTGGGLSASLTVTDSAPGSPHSLPVSGAGSTFALTTPTSSATVPAGKSASYALNFAPTGGFSGMVTLSCTTTAPAASCSVKPGTLTLNAPNTAAATATVTTTAAGAAPPHRHLPPGPRPWLWYVLGAVLALGYSLVSKVRQPTRRALAANPGPRIPNPGFWALAGALVLVLAWAGCGGSSSTTPSGPTSTPAGTYQVTVTASSASVSQNVSLTLTVQ